MSGQCEMFSYVHWQAADLETRTPRMVLRRTSVKRARTAW